MPHEVQEVIWETMPLIFLGLIILLVSIVSLRIGRETRQERRRQEERHREAMEELRRSREDR